MAERSPLRQAGYFAQAVVLALFLGLCKRRSEVVLLDQDAARHRRILATYTTTLLDSLISIVASSTVMAYSLYTFFASTVPQDHAMMATIPFVLYGIFRYLLLVHRTDFAGAPEEALWKDVPLVADLVLWVAAAGIVLHYFK